MPERDGTESAPLRVGLVADTAGRPGGIGRYTTELIAALGKRDDVRLVVAAPPSTETLVHRLTGDRLDAFLAVPDHGQLPIALWERYVSGARFERAGAQVVHGTKHLLPRTSLPTVLMVHDIMTITRAHESSRAKRLLLPRQFRAALEQAAFLVAASAATRDRIIRLDPAWEAKTVVVLNGLSRDLVNVPAVPVPGLGGARFALVVGDLAPRKNVDLLLDVWERIAVDAPGFRLVVLGHEGPHSERTTARLRSLEARGLARWLHGASDASLRWCYEHATVVLFPSLEEGFGFPVLEALTFDAPVLASTDPAIVETAAGRAGVTHLDPHDTEAWRAAIVRAAGVPREPIRDPRLPPGAPTWDENAAQLVTLYRRALGRSG
jgi:glycosyltransferase involved in cell wall biosynthesis